MIPAVTIMPLIPLTQSASALHQIRLIATDMDGTLTIGEKFTPELFHALQQLQRAQITVIVVTGRSAGWVSAINHYFPVFGAICENGGLFYHGGSQELLVDIGDRTQHRQKLATIFHRLQAQFPQIRESSDNPFRLTDWTFDVAGLGMADLTTMAQICAQAGWGFTYSTVQCHIAALEQEKAQGLQRVLQQHFPQLSPSQVVTVGDSPNDVSLFNPAIFPHSVGVANVVRYTKQLAHLPAFITKLPEGQGFCELVNLILGKK
jgi:hydroxymethylpyrimidine pyrophosphatase-like HAD family hydrolase